MPPGTAATLRALVARPALWPTALRVGRSLVPRRWWRHRPFLPLPDRGWVRFRLVTAYGGDGSDPPQATDLITWLDWCRRQPR